MHHMKTVDVPATTKTVVDRITCDLCGRGLEDHLKGKGLSSYYSDDVEIGRRHGTNYPEGGSGSESKVDMCGECWETKFIPWLKDQGATQRVNEWSY